MRSQILQLLASQAPTNFAMVMSTGIVSVALYMLGRETAALMLLWINVAMFIGLVAAYTARALLYPSHFFGDAVDHGKGPGYLTIVAGTCILGNQFALLLGRYDIALILFWFGVVVWVLTIWGNFFAMFTSPNKPPVQYGINGAWLVATVCTQAIVILGCIVIDHTGWDRETAYFLFASLFGLGYVLYIMIITLIFYRFCYKQLEPHELSPTFWINAGAMAVTTLAGSELMMHAAVSPFIASILPFLKGMSVMAWGVAGWWVIMLFLLGLWRHGTKRFPFTYTPDYWGMVFPMGMYTACTFALSDALHITSIRIISELFIFVALLAWALTFCGLCAFLWRSIRAREAAQ